MTLRGGEKGGGGGEAGEREEGATVGFVCSVIHLQNINIIKYSVDRV